MDQAMRKAVQALARLVTAFLTADRWYATRLFFIQRLLLSLLGVALFLLGYVPRTEDLILRPYFGMPVVSAGPAGALLGVWQRFDAIHFLRIASTGYSAPDLSAFFPLFPLVSRWASDLLGQNVLLGSFLVANAACLAALNLLYFWMLDEGYNQALAKRTTLFLVWFPTAFFLFTPYSESMFLMLAIAGFWSVKRHRWFLAGALFALASLTRVAGAVLALVILSEWFFTRKRHTAAQSLKAWFSAALPILAFFGFEIWKVERGFPRTLEVQALYWHRTPSLPWQPIVMTAQRLAGRMAGFIEVVDLLIVLGMILLGVMIIRRLPRTSAVYHWGLLLVGLLQVRAGQPLSGQGRYAVMLFPAFIVLAQLARGPIASRAVAYGFLLLNVFLAGQFILWGWVG
jgi:hypothetical protein